MSGIDSRPLPLFLFSLPRSGSTLCQRILGSHQDIATVNEPHILLPILYSLKDDDVRSTYNHHYAAWAIQDFCNDLPNGFNDCLEEMREYALRLYAKASSHQARYFLDKTPKYHFIVEDIFRLFPEAKAIYVWRNPLSIISSLIDTWGGGNWNIFHFKVDLYQGLENLIKTYLKYSDRVCALRFEDVLLNPEDAWRQVFNYLELPFDRKVLTDFAQVRLTGRVRDPHSSLEKYQAMVQSPLNKWKGTLNNPLRKAWCLSYLKWIGKERLAVMGYDIDALIDELNALPLSLHHLKNDIIRIPLGEAYHLFELQLMKQKFLTWRKGQRIYMHN